MRRTIEKVMDVLANLGFVMRDTRRDKVGAAHRQWGPEVEGFVLSLHLVEPIPTLSVALKNTRPVERRASLPGWLFYYSVHLTTPNGSNAQLTPFGRQILSPERSQQTVEVVFPPGKPVMTEIPIATLYDMRAPGEYRVFVTCPAPGSGETLTSNELTIFVKGL